MFSSESAEYSASASKSFSSTSLASSISPGARRARMRSRRNTGTSSSWIENSTPRLRSSVLCWLRMKATRTERGFSSSSIRKSLRTCSSPLSSS